MDAVIKCLADDREVEQVLPEETNPASHASLGALGRHSASDAHLIGTLGGVMQVITCEQRGDELANGHLTI